MLGGFAHPIYVSGDCAERNYDRTIAMTECRICGKRDCDDDCEELQAIYREHQREKLRDIDVDEITCDVCGVTYSQDSHDLCRVLGCWLEDSE